MFMPLRLIELIIPEKLMEEVEHSLNNQDVISVVPTDLRDKRILIRVLVTTENSEKIMDTLNKKCCSAPDFSIIVLPVLARLPREETSEELINSGGKREEKKSRISRDELYQTLNDAASFTGIHLTLVILSTIVAAIGILADSSTVIIGAMVIAPLLPPAVTLSLANLLVDWALALRVSKLILLDSIVAVVISVLITRFLHIDETTTELMQRTAIDIADVFLALAAGAAGVIGFVSGVSSALVGVMVAVALLPPLVSIGLLIGMSKYLLAWKAFLLFTTNFICINLTGIVTLWIMGIKPWSEKDSEKADKAALIGFIFWTLFLFGIVLTIVFSEGK
jgi:uncharacterized hydrophobic protein (TIGR00341 family)